MFIADAPAAAAQATRNAKGIIMRGATEQPTEFQAGALAGKAVVGA